MSRGVPAPAIWEYPHSRVRLTVWIHEGMVWYGGGSPDDKAGLGHGPTMGGIERRVFAQVHTRQCRKSLNSSGGNCFALVDGGSEARTLTDLLLLAVAVDLAAVAVTGVARTPTHLQLSPPFRDRRSRCALRFVTQLAETSTAAFWSSVDLWSEPGTASSRGRAGDLADRHLV